MPVLLWLVRSLRFRDFIFKPPWVPPIFEFISVCSFSDYGVTVIVHKHKFNFKVVAVVRVIRDGGDISNNDLHNVSLTSPLSLTAGSSSIQTQNNLNFGTNSVIRQLSCRYFIIFYLNGKTTECYIETHGAH